MGSSAQVDAATQLYHRVYERGGKGRKEARVILKTVLSEEIQRLSEPGVRRNPYLPGRPLLPPLTDRRRAHLPRTLVLEPLLQHPGISVRLREILEELCDLEVRIADLLIAAGQFSLHEDRYWDFYHEWKALELPYPENSLLHAEALTAMEAVLEKALPETRSLLAHLPG